MKTRDDEIVVIPVKRKSAVGDIFAIRGTKNVAIIYSEKSK